MNGAIRKAIRSQPTDGSAQDEPVQYSVLSECSVNGQRVRSRYTVMAVGKEKHLAPASGASLCRHVTSSSDANSIKVIIDAFSRIHRNNHNCCCLG